ncbi:MAG: hypothetical protein ABFD17_09070 [Anaerolineaceae bacterium]
MARRYRQIAIPCFAGTGAKEARDDGVGGRSPVPASQAQAQRKFTGRSPRFARDDEIDRTGLQTAHAN